MTRLSDLSQIPAGIDRPGYDPSAHGAGIVHLGLGAFHRAHQAVATDDALAASGGDWRIVGASLRSRAVPDQLNPQNGLYTLIVRGPGEPRLRVIGAIKTVLYAPEEGEALLAALTAPETKIVSLTVTERGYGMDAATGGLDTAHPAIAADLGSDFSAPQSAVGLIVAALRARRDAGTGPFTVLSCDNLSHNGKVVARLVAEMAERVDPALADWIGANVTFPSTMVDRITPASTERTLATIADAMGIEDHGATETEPFTQWIIEDDFCAGRPGWEAGGALFVADVAPYEKLKLRMLNGAHSMLAYSGFLAGHTHVRDVMGDPDLVALITRHMDAAAKTLDPVPGIDVADYARQLRERFANPAIAHQTYQIAMDGTQKLPQRLFEGALVAMEAGEDLAPFAFAAAAWMAYARGHKHDGEPYALRDPREDEIRAALEAAGTTPEAITRALLALPGLAPAPLRDSTPFTDLVAAKLQTILDTGMPAAIAAEAR